MARLAHPDFIARGSTLTFAMDGETCHAIEGETIAAALTAAGHRHFKRDRYGQARGLSCGMGVCFECEVSVDGGAPVRACMTAVAAGMDVRSGTYRKPVPPPGRRGAAQRVTQHCEVLVVGAGPAGTSAAVALAEAGVDVLLADERASPGGQYFKPLGSSQRFRDGRGADTQYRDGMLLVSRLRASGARVLDGATVWAAFARADGGFEAGIVTPGTHVTVTAERVVLAAGAFESIPAFPGWTLPGVMTTGAAQGLARSYRVAAGERVLVAGNGPLNLQLACELLAGGVSVVAVAEAAPSPLPRRLADGLGLVLSDLRLAGRGLAYLATLRRHGVPVLFGYHVARAEGDDRVESVSLARIGDDGRLLAGTDRAFRVDALTLGYGLQPSNELARALGCRHESSAPGVIAPLRNADGETTVPGVFVIGDGGSLGGAQVAMAEGRIAAAAIAAQLSRGPVRDVAAARRQLRRQRRFQRHLWSFYRAPTYVPVEEDALICRCESVPVGAIRALVADGVTDFGTLKRCSRVGMGSCQGRYCQRSLATLVADLTGAVPAADTLFAPRPPSKPVAIDALADEKPDWAGYRSVDEVAALPARPVDGTGASLEAEVLVIGAGIIGLTTALHLAEAGVDVLVVDAAPPFAQASGNNAGSLHGQMLSSDFGIAPGRDSPAGQALALQRLGIAAWQALEARLGADFEMHLTGGLVVAASDEEVAYLQRKIDLERQHGLDVELLDQAGLRERLPAVSPAMRAAAYCQGEGKINPLLAAPAILAATRQAGVRLLTPCTVHAIAHDGGDYRVDASAARIRCRTVVNAAGAWAAGIARLVGSPLPVRTAPQQMIVTEPLDPIVPMLVAAAGRHLTLKQVANGNIIIGGGWPAGYDTARGRGRNLRDSIEGNLWVARHVIPALAGVRVLRSWATIGVMIDGAPILGEDPARPGFFNCVGANGYTMGPVIGRITAGLILGEAPPLDLRPFRLERFKAAG